MLDTLIVEFDKALRTLFVKPESKRAFPVPDGLQAPDGLEEGDKVRAGALMRINHAGEVCAQALYQGQAMACSDLIVRQMLVHAASEEMDHLSWAEQRINELAARPSFLNPVWYIGSLSLGFFVGKLGGVSWSLGFLAETERQVELHLGNHLLRLPERDVRSLAIVRQMKVEEKSHAEAAIRLGARELPPCAKGAMRLAAGLMVWAAYYI